MMASSQSSPYIAVTSLVMCFLCYLPSIVLSQNPGISSGSLAGIVAQCGPRFLALAPCAPFAQGTAPSPAIPCCDNLKQLYNLQPSCVCLLLNDITTLTSFPMINSTLALQLLALCNLQFGIPACSAGVPNLPPIISPASQVSFGAKNNPAASRDNSSSTVDKNNSTVAASPMVTVVPRLPAITRHGSGWSAGINLKTEGHLVVAVMVAVASCTLLLES